MFSLVAQYLRDVGWQDWDVLQFRTPSRVVWSIYQPRAKHPTFVAKYCSGPHFERGLRECSGLEALSAFADGLRIPRLLFQARDEDGCVYVQSAVRGRPLRGELPASSRELAAQFRLIEPWLRAFQAAVPTAANSPAVFAGILDAASSQAPAALLAAAHECLPALSSVPAVAVHGDFWSHNTLLDGGRVSVVDWETLHYGSPLEDLCTYAAAAIRDDRADPKRGGDNIGTVFFGASRLARRVRETAGRILAQRQLPPELLRPLFLMSVIHRLTSVQFVDNPSWHAFARRYAAAGCPAPWSHSDWGVSQPHEALAKRDHTQRG